MGLRACRHLPAELGRRRAFKHLNAWIEGERQPTLRQLEGFAHATHASLGYFFLPSPPEERLPLPDLRTLDGRAPARPSVHLLDTVYLCQHRQAWYREQAQHLGASPLDFLGTATTQMPPADAAGGMAQVLGFDLAARKQASTWEEALRLFISNATDAGILVMVSGVVGTNAHRRLDPEEFRGFALADPIAPLVFINGADTKSAQMFTLAHELAHLWLGQSALSAVDALHPSTAAVERWCDQVAAELLVPAPALRAATQPGEALPSAMSRLAREFKVSTLVVLRRLRDTGTLSPAHFEQAWQDEVRRLRAIMARRPSGGSFYNTQGSRVGKRFARAVIASALEGQTPFREAFTLLGVASMGTFNELSHRLGVG
ncbi:MAG: ImmA/IrrE family metallo-endopeptidase [bacterium]